MSASIPLAISLAPELGTWLFGSTSEQAAAAIAQAVEHVTGTSDEAAAHQVIARDPDKALRLRLELAKLAAQQAAAERREELAALGTQLTDSFKAPSEIVRLARAGTGITWGALAVSVVVLLTFGVVMWMTLTNGMPAGSEGVLNVLLGMLGTGFAAVTNYWLGSSVGSQQKNALLALSQPAGTALPREAQR